VSKSKKQSRIHDLMLLCADNLDRGCEPLHHEFLVEHSITLDECMTLAEQMAVAIRAYVRTPRDEQLRLMVRACVDEAELREEMVESISNDLKMKRVTAKLVALGKASASPR
jgi:hypothetical protein